jgi:hypothetical protein
MPGKTYLSSVVPPPMAVNLVNTGNGLVGGPITDTGTISLVPATEYVLGGVQIINSTSSTSTTKAATASSVKTAFDAATAASALASTKLPLTGGTMTGTINFAPGQTFDALFLPIATSTSLGVVIPSTGLNVSPGGYVTTVNNGTVTGVTAGVGLGSPASGNTITNSGTINLLPPTTDGLVIGGVKRGANIAIGTDGQITTENLLQTNNPYAYNSYIFPAATSPVPAAPGANGNVLTLVDRVTGEVGWTPIGTISTVTVGPGLTSTTVNGAVTINVAPSGVLPPVSPPKTFGATGLIPTLTVDYTGKVVSAGQANPFAPFQIPTVTAPFVLVLDFIDNNTNWDFTLQENTSLQNPSNAVSGQTGSILIRQNPITPYVLTFDTAWKFPYFTPPSITPVAASVDMLQFVVVDASYIVVTKYLTELG